MLLASNLHAHIGEMKVEAMRRILGATLVFLLVSCAELLQAQDLGKPILLVAQPALQGPYTQTVLVVVPMGDKHMGFILNRATQTKLAAAFPEHGPSKLVADPIYFGGPEATDALFAVLQRDPGKPSVRMFGNLFMTGNGKNIDRIIEQTPNEARYFAGFVGWMPEELAKEVAAGFWFVAEANAATVLRKDTSSLWQELVKRLGGGKAPKRPGDREARAPAPSPS
jgi:putative transcriptional regulator